MDIYLRRTALHWIFKSSSRTVRGYYQLYLFCSVIPLCAKVRTYCTARPPLIIWSSGFLFPFCPKIAESSIKKWQNKEVIEYFLSIWKIKKLPRVDAVQICCKWLVAVRHTYMQQDVKEKIRKPITFDESFFINKTSNLR